MKGVWRYPLDGQNAGRALVAGVGDGKLVADVEGVTLISDGGKRFLLVSSQGDSAFEVWQVSGVEPVYVGRFPFAAGAGFDAGTDTDEVGRGAWRDEGGKKGYTSV